MNDLSEEIKGKNERKLNKVTSLKYLVARLIMIVTLNFSNQRFADLLSQNEHELVKYLAKINKLYQENLNKPTQFMTLFFVGMLPAGSSTKMERMSNDVLTIVQEGTSTGTRFPLDTTWIHDETCDEPRCRRSGHDVSSRVLILLYLEYRARNIVFARFVDIPGIIFNRSTGNDDLDDEKPKFKLFILLEPTEYTSNKIIDFCDEIFGSRNKWVQNAIFLMTKFD